MNQKDHFIEMLESIHTKYEIHHDRGELIAFKRKMSAAEFIIQVDNTIKHLGIEYQHSYWFFDKDGNFLGVAHYEY